MADRTDPELIEACLAGRPRAWDELVERYSRLVYSVPRRMGMNDADAADVYQNVFLILYRKLDTLRDDTLLARWLLTTAQREAWRLGRRQRNRPEHGVEELEYEAPDDDQLDRLEQQHIVRSALDRLGGPCEKLLTALFLNPGNPSYDAIAESLGMKVGSIGPTRARCFRKLEKLLTDMGLDASVVSSE